MGAALFTGLIVLILGGFIQVESDIVADGPDLGPNWISDRSCWGRKEKGGLGKKARGK